MKKSSPLRCFYILAIVNDAVMNREVQIPLGDNGSLSFRD